MNDIVKMFDYWAFHNDGTVQFFQICEGRIYNYQEYDRVEDAPVMFIDERSFNSDFIGPLRELRYHGRSYIDHATRYGQKPEDSGSGI